MCNGAVDPYSQREIAIRRVLVRVAPPSVAQKPFQTYSFKPALIREHCGAQEILRAAILLGHGNFMTLRTSCLAQASFPVLKYSLWRIWVLYVVIMILHVKEAPTTWQQILKAIALKMFAAEAWILAVITRWRTCSGLRAELSGDLFCDGDSPGTCSNFFSETEFIFEALNDDHEICIQCKSRGSAQFCTEVLFDFTAIPSSPATTVRMKCEGSDTCSYPNLTANVTLYIHCDGGGTCFGLNVNTSALGISGFGNCHCCVPRKMRSRWLLINKPRYEAGSIGEPLPLKARTSRPPFAPTGSEMWHIIFAKSLWACSATGLGKRWKISETKPSLIVKGSLVRNFRSYEQLDSLSSGSSQ